MPLPPASTLETPRNSYRIKKTLREGGMGRVLAATDGSGRQVVIKEPRLTGDHRQDKIRLEKLRVEAEILSALNHPNIVRYIESVQDGDAFYLVLEHIPGLDMRTRYRNNPPLEQITEKYILQVLDALQYVHMRNIIHRDINPRNILVGSEVKIIDFGAAKKGYTQILPIDQTIIGTPGWSAPEQFAGVTTPQSDIYAAGATLFFLLTGKAPELFVDSNKTRRRLEKALNTRSKRWTSIVMRALTQDPKDRYRVATEMADDIRGKPPSIGPSIVCMGTRYPIKGVLTIGRSETCDLTIEDPAKYLSRRHSVIYRKQDGLWIVDSNSVNGTFLRRGDRFRKISRSKLRDGDIIALCYRPEKGPYVTLRIDLP